MNEPKHITLNLRPVVKPIRLRVTKPKEPIPIGIMAALQGPPGQPGTASTAVTVKGLQNDVFLQWLASLQYGDEAQPSFGAIRWHDGPATYVAGAPFYKVEPYFAHLAAYCALEAAPERAGELSLRWLNWWMTHRNPTTQTALIHFANADGSALATELPAASPAVTPNDEDATDSNAALFLLVLGRHLSLFGPDGLVDGWKVHTQEVYDFMLTPGVRADDGLTWAKPTYPIKYLMDNVEVWAGVDAAVSIFHMMGDAARRDSAKAWRDLLATAIEQRFWDANTGLWNHSIDGAGTVSQSNLDNPYPDALAQVWPAIFGLSNKGGYAKLASHYPNWHQHGINAGTNSADAQLALAAAMAGDLDRAQAWLVAVGAERRQSGSFRWPFTCADAAISAVVARMSKVAPTSDSASVSVSIPTNFLTNYLLQRG